MGQSDEGAGNIRQAISKGNKLAEAMKTETINLDEVRQTVKQLPPMADIALPTEPERRAALEPIARLGNEFQLLADKLGLAKKKGEAKTIIDAMQEKMNFLWAARKRLVSEPATKMRLEQEIEKGFAGEARKVSTENEILKEIINCEKAQLHGLDQILATWGALKKDDPRAVAAF